MRRTCCNLPPAVLQMGTFNASAITIPGMETATLADLTVRQLPSLA